MVLKGEVQGALGRSLTGVVGFRLGANGTRKADFFPSVCFSSLLLLKKSTQVRRLGTVYTKIKIKYIKMIKPDPPNNLRKTFFSWCFDMLPLCPDKPLLPSSKLNAFKQRDASLAG